MASTFAGKASFNADISNWNVEQVTDMSKMFHGATVFDADISKWNVASTTNMMWMFYDATFFNADISNWNVARVTDTRNMFGGAASFNADISKWNVARVTNMELMFSRALYFNADISKWDVARVTDTRNMFGAAISFNADISNWNVARVTHMSYMFYDAASFNADISKWNVARATHMSHMFAGAISFNVDISKWNVARVADMDSMFNGATSFKQTLCPWVHSRAQKFDMFYGSPGSICATTTCPKCGINRIGQLSCCFRGGAWFKNCVIDPGESKLKHTWFKGVQACEDAVTTTTAMTACPKCGRTTDGQLNCCGEGGSWRGQCGMVGDTRFAHTWSDGEQYCSTNKPPKPISSINAPAATCPKCVPTKSGKSSCCARGGSWFKKCGEPGDSNFEHTWFEGNLACELTAESITNAIGRVSTTAGTKT
jgi:surface protein